MLAGEFLCGAARIELVGAGGGWQRRCRVIVFHDEVGASVIAPDDRVPQRFARAGSARRERKQGQGGELLRVVPQDLLVALDACEMAEIVVHGDTGDGVQEQVPSHFPGGVERQLPLSLVHRTARMECDDPAPAEPIEEPAEFAGRVAQFLVVVVRGEPDAADAASDVDVPYPFEEVPHAGVARGGRSIDLLRLGALVRLPHSGDVEDRESEALLIAQRDHGTRPQFPCELPPDVEHHRNGPELAVGKPHRLQDVRVGLPIHEAVKGREPAVHQQLQVAELPLRECQRRHVERFALQRLRFHLADEEGLQRCAVRLRLHGLSRCPGGRWMQGRNLLDSGVRLHRARPFA